MHAFSFNSLPNDYRIINIQLCIDHRLRPPPSTLTTIIHLQQQASSPIIRQRTIKLWFCDGWFSYWVCPYTVNQRAIESQSNSSMDLNEV
ncbi:unnamed protein product [Lactuca saligna]|nr:unnamed protein product [Lactuca saligna]